MALSLPLKHRFPALHRTLVPLYWNVARPAIRPFYEFQLQRAFERFGRRPEWADVSSTLARDIPSRLSPHDRYAGLTSARSDHYAHVGYSALRCIQRVLEDAGSPAPTRILDFPCGHARVQRMFSAAFPDASITACDLDRGMVDFCAQELGASGVYSKDSPSEIELDGRFDLIWVGSLLTHFDAPLWGDFLRFFEAHLEPGGLVIFTTHGDRVQDRIESGEYGYGLHPAALGDLVRDRQTKGFGFAHYPDSGEYYGISLSTRRSVQEIVQAVPTLEFVSHIPHGWDEHQDVFGYKRSA